MGVACALCIACARWAFAPFNAAARDVAALRAGKNRRVVDADIFASLVGIDGARARATHGALRLVTNVASH